MIEHYLNDESIITLKEKFGGHIFNKNLGIFISYSNTKY